jgi:hypothetical protein
MSRGRSKGERRGKRRSDAEIKVAKVVVEDVGEAGVEATVVGRAV